MPWNETCVMNLKISMLSDWISGKFTKTMLASKYNVSRPTVDKWLSRVSQQGVIGLYEQSRKPHNNPNQTPEAISELIVKTKGKYLHWGPKKINDHLKNKHPDINWPADSTTGNILKKAGLVKPRSRPKGQVSPFPEHLTESTKPCQIWNVDFKGNARLGNGEQCYPLTISDDFCRYLLEIRGLSSTSHENVKDSFEKLFYEFGLPEGIKSDNGVPFASTAIGGLSQLSKWFVRLGIRPERIEKGKPTQNGRHERMHRTLKNETMKPTKHSFAAQQETFERFRYEYNEERSHEGIGRKTPSSLFKPSSIVYHGQLPEVNYSQDKTVRSVRCNGEIKWKGNLIYLGGVLAKERVGLVQQNESTWNIYYSFLHIGNLNEKTMKVERIKQGR